MKGKTVYIYLISIIIIATIIIIYSTSTEGPTTPTPVSEVNPNAAVPNDEIHKNLGTAPNKQNVSGDFKKKMALMKDKYESNPADTSNSKEYARLLAAAHQPQKAVEIYEGILSRDKNRIDIRFELATVYYNLKDYSDAESQIEKVLDVEPNNLEALYNLGAINAASGNIKKAKELWNNIIKKDPNSEAAKFAKSSLEKVNK